MIIFNKIYFVEQFFIYKEITKGIPQIFQNPTAHFPSYDILWYICYN